MIGFLVAVIVFLCWVIYYFYCRTEDLSYQLKCRDKVVASQCIRADKRDAEIWDLINRIEHLTEDREDMQAGEYHGMGN